MAFIPPFIGFPGQQQQFPQGSGQVPVAPPPQFVPQQPAATTFAVDPGAISGCLFRYTYIWPRFGAGFWFYPIFVGRRSVSGFRWNGFFWMFTGMDLRQINTFTCY